MVKRDGIYSSVDTKGNIHYSGPLEITKGNHSNMTPRTVAYLPGENEPKVGMYDRGHITASSLSPHATNDKTNIAPMHSDLNRAGGAYYAMEDGQRTALTNGASIHSEKTAFVGGQPDEKPSAFMVSDTITYESGQVDHVNLSFTNASYEEQQAWNDQSAALLDTFDAPNPGGGLRDSMSTAEYSELMKSTDEELPSITEEYASAGCSSLLGEDSNVSISNDTTAEANSADAAADAGVSAGDDGSADCDADN